MKQLRQKNYDYKIGRLDWTNQETGGATEHNNYES